MSRKYWVIGILFAVIALAFCYRQLVLGKKMRGVLIVTELTGSGRRRFEASGRRIAVFESSTREVQQGNDLRIKSNRDRFLFTIKLKKDNGVWRPEIEPGSKVRLSGSLRPSNREALIVGDAGLKIEFDHFHKD
jgi:hypothetical protein